MKEIAGGLGDALQQIRALQESLKRDQTAQGVEQSKTFEVVVPEDSQDQKRKGPAAGNQQATKPGPQAPRTGEGVKAAEPVKLSPQQKQQQLTAAVEQYKATLHHFNKAKEAQAKARATNDPSMKHYYMRLAEENASWGQGITRKLNRTLKGETADLPPNALNRKVIQPLAVRQGKAYQQLLQLSGQDAKGPVQNLFDATKGPLIAPRPDNAKPRDQNLFGIRKYPTINKADPNLLQFDNGKRINISALHKALKKKPFARCGKGEQVCPTPALLKFLANEKSRRKLEKVGGVALQATFSMLEASGISDFRGGMDIKMLDRPILISLKRLYKAVKPYADTGKWARLPEAMRYPGNIGRVHGFVLDPVVEDIFLVATPAENKYRRMDIDSLILALRVTWRDGFMMGVSLDRYNKAGVPLQSIGGKIVGTTLRPRFINVPRISVPAKIMIEADYAMKMLDQTEGFNADQKLFPVSKILGRNAVAVLKAMKRGRGAYQRKWLTSKQLGPDALHVSTTGRTVLFESQVQVLSETLEYIDGKKQGTGTSLPYEIDSAKVMTERMGLFEASTKVRPKGIFARLHGLADLVTMARFMRISELKYELLDRIADLPYRRLRGTEAIPAFYRIFNKRVKLSGTRWSVEISGGVNLDSEFSAYSMRRFFDPRISEMEEFIDAHRDATGFVLKTALVIGVPEDMYLTEQSLKLQLLKAIRLFDKGKLKEAAIAFTQTIQDFPEFPYGWAWLARTRLKLGVLRAAQRAISQAMIRAPWDNRYKAITLDIAWRKDGEAALKLFDADMRRLIGEHYAELAIRANAYGKIGDVIRIADWAIHIYPQGARGHFYRAKAHHKKKEYVQAIERYSTAIRLNPKYVDAYNNRGVAYKNNGQADRAIADYNTAIKLDPNFTVAYFNRGNTYFKKGQPDRAIADYNTAIKLDPKFAYAYLNRGSTYAKKGDYDYDRAIASYDMAIKLNPIFALAYTNRGIIYLLKGQLDRAIADFDKVIEFDPRDTTAYTSRGWAYEKRGYVARAVDDYRKVLALDPSHKLARQKLKQLGVTP